jgi:hypothetical protein
MLDLSSAHDVCDTHHQRFLDAALPESLRREAFARFSPSVYSEAELTSGRRAWQARALDEYRSQVLLTQLLNELTELGAAFDVLGLGIRVVRDEARHVELCRRMVTALGGDNALPGEPGWVRADPQLPLLQRILWTTTGFLCVGETASTQLIVEVRDAASDPLSHAVLSCLAADESIHGQFGWTLLELLAPELTPADRDQVREWLPRFIEGLERTVAASGPKQKTYVSPFGGVTSDRRLEVMRACLRDEILPRFAALDLSPP